MDFRSFCYVFVNKDKKDYKWNLLTYVELSKKEILADCESKMVISLLIICLNSVKKYIERKKGLSRLFRISFI